MNPFYGLLYQSASPSVSPAVATTHHCRASTNLLPPSVSASHFSPSIAVTAIVSPSFGHLLSGSHRATTSAIIVVLTPLFRHLLSGNSAITATRYYLFLANQLKIKEALHGSLKVLKREDETCDISYGSFDPNVLWSLIAIMVIIHELSLRSVEYKGFREMMAHANPVVKQMSRNTLKNEILKLYHIEKCKPQYKSLPSDSEWDLAATMVENLRSFYMLTETFSADEHIECAHKLCHDLVKEYEMKAMVLSDGQDVGLENVHSKSSSNPNKYWDSAFSTEDRFLSPHRSKFHFDTLESLMCAQNWIWAFTSRGGVSDDEIFTGEEFESQGSRICWENLCLPVRAGTSSLGCGTGLKVPPTVGALPRIPRD
ncbi:hypothetical protein WN944_022194 [Citrus x changshan-huyou]|uniref:Uncharacterized protein n=1 Tax=Citrus x changshan-huyou TaxID=2935761 RepID=A0AAP0N314_9ROSI